jgi:ribosomal protein S16
MVLLGLQVMADDICTFDDAKRYCDTMPLDNIEGIWEYPEDHVCILIMRNQTYGSGESYPYKLIVVDSYDAMTAPGEEIGTLEPTPTPTKYKMVLYTQRKKDKLSTPKSCSAELAHNNYALIVKSDRRWIDINPFAILPKFWRIARLKSDKPTEKLPKGLIKIYPSYDGNGSSYFKPRYL